MNAKKNCFTIGEMAALFDLPKQTLLYYAKVGLLTPAYLEKNNYRYYDVKQYHDLDVIINLRKIGVSIDRIRKYLKNRNKADLIKILEDRYSSGEMQIVTIRKHQASLQKFLGMIKQADKFPLNVFLTENLPDQPVFFSKPLHSEMSSYERLRIFSAHVRSVFMKTKFRSEMTGWVIRQEEFFSENFYQSMCYFTPCPASQLSVCNSKICGGIYVSIYLNGTYHRRIAEIFPLIQEYLMKNNLIPNGNVYILPIKDNWQTSESEDYIFKLSLPVTIQNKVV